MDRNHALEERTYRRALRLLRLRPRARAELAACLARRAPAHVVEEVLRVLEEQGLVDDARFARWWATSRRSLWGFGIARIRRELQTKGVEEEAVERALEDLEAEDEVAMAEGWARSRLRLYAGLDRSVAARRLGASLARRGFHTDTVLQVLRRLGLLGREKP